MHTSSPKERCYALISFPIEVNSRQASVCQWVAQYTISYMWGVGVPQLTPTSQIWSAYSANIQVHNDPDDINMHTLECTVYKQYTCSTTPRDGYTTVLLANRMELMRWHALESRLWPMHTELIHHQSDVLETCLNKRGIWPDREYTYCRGSVTKSTDP